METIKRTNSKDRDFIDLVALLDADLAERDGADHAFYHQFNSISSLNHTLVLYNGSKPIGCGAIKRFDSTRVEVKRMYVLPEHRGNGHASRLLEALETWAKDLDATHCVLETGKRQPEAIRLYKKNGYKEISNYGQYQGISNSICFEKAI